jgi:Uma2 family endonuclease
MATVTTAPMTAEEFFEWVNRPENEGRYWELEHGEVVEMPPPGEVHGSVCAMVTYLLMQFAFRRGKGRVVSNDTGLVVQRAPDTVRGPDVMFFDDSQPLSQLSRSFATQLPALVVEVLSPSDQWSKLQRRLKQYRDRGVPLIWVIDPEDRTVTAYQTANPIEQLLEETDELTGNSVLPDFRCRVADLFAVPGQQP